MCVRARTRERLCKHKEKQWFVTNSSNSLAVKGFNLTRKRAPLNVNFFFFFFTEPRYWPVNANPWRVPFHSGTFYRSLWVQFIVVVNSHLGQNQLSIGVGYCLVTWLQLLEVNGMCMWMCVSHGYIPRSFFLSFFSVSLSFFFSFFSFSPFFFTRPVSFYFCRRAL